MLSSMNGKHGGVSVKGSVKLIKRVIHFYSLCQISPRYHFKLACVVLQMAVKEFFERHF